MAAYIPTEHYIGIKKSRVDDKGIPLAFMTPEGTNSAAKKRKVSVDHWTKGMIWNPKTQKNEPGKYELKTIANIPQTGFEITDVVSRYSTSNKLWRINDPRGFQLEVSSSSLLYILMNSKLENGKFTESMVWGRNGPDNVLIPIDSEKYKKYANGVSEKEKPVSLKTVKRGYKVLLTNGEEGIYYKTLSCFFVAQNSDTKDFYIHHEKRHIFVGGYGLSTKKSISIAKILESNEVSLATAVETTRKLIIPNDDFHGYSDNLIYINPTNIASEDISFDFIADANVTGYRKFVLDNVIGRKCINYKDEISWSNMYSRWGSYMYFRGDPNNNRWGSHYNDNLYTKSPDDYYGFFRIEINGTTIDIKNNKKNN